RGECARAIPCRANHDTDRGEFVLGLDDRVLAFLGLGIDAQARAMPGERIGERRGWRNRIPGAYSGAAVDRAERGSRVAFDEDSVLHRIRTVEPKANRAFEVLER